MLSRNYYFFIFCLFSFAAFSQDNYEIQVYGAETVEKGKTMLELLSNYTIDGNKETGKVLLPTNHIIHATI